MGMFDYSILDESGQAIFRGTDFDALDEEHLKQIYKDYSDLFSIRIHHSGLFAAFPGREYIYGEEWMGMLGDNSIEDVRWLCSLSESEIDLLISLKEMAIQRATFIGHKSLSDKFDLKMLGGLTFVLMQVFKERLGRDIPQLETKSFLVKHEISREFREMGKEELMAYIGSDKKKRISELFAYDGNVHDSMPL